MTTRKTLLGMQKLTSFPIKQLGYYLKLKVLEQMMPKKTIELVKVNTGFRSLLLRTPWIVFGRHVYRISSWRGKIFITKFPSKDRGCRFRIDTTLHFPLIKRIDFCGYYYYEHDAAAALNRLKSVKHLLCFSDFREENRVASKLFGEIIATKLTDCKWVSFVGSAAFHSHYDAFAKTTIKMLEFLIWQDENGSLEEIVQTVLEKGIPSKNLEAAIFVDAPDNQEMFDRLVDLLSHYPGMKRYRGFTKMANKLLGIKERFRVRRNSFKEKSSLVFRRKIDLNRDCVYVLQSWAPGFWNPDGTVQFLAFYIDARLKMTPF